MKKGTKIYIIGNWNGHEGTYYIRKGIIQSYGKERSTVYIESDGAMAKELFYVKYLNIGFGTCFMEFNSDLEAEEFAFSQSKGYLEHIHKTYMERSKTYSLSNDNYSTDMWAIAEKALKTEPSIVWI